MQKKTVAVLVTLVVVLSVFAGLIIVKPSTEQTTTMNIIINPDGSVTPSNAPIQVYDNVYKLTDNVYGTIKILKSNIVLNGGGYTLSGPYNGSQANVWVVGNGPNQSPNLIAEYIIGIDFGGRNVNSTIIQNINVRNFSIGMYVWTQNNTIVNCKIYDSIVGILLSGENNTIIYNTIQNNRQGLFMGFNNEGNTSIPSDIVIHHNDFENNNLQMNGCNCKSINSTESPHHWDDGKQGNYWSDYNGTDANHDGIGDTPYVIDALNIDRYPMMQSPAQQLTQILTPTFDPIIIGLSLGILVCGVIFALWLLRRAKTQQALNRARQQKPQ